MKSGSRNDMSIATSHGKFRMDSPMPPDNASSHKVAEPQGLRGSGSDLSHSIKGGTAQMSGTSSAGGKKAGNI